MKRPIVSNRVLSTDEKDKLKSQIFDLGNVHSASQTTKIAYRTIISIFERGYGKPNHITKLLNYCDEVQGLTPANLAD